MGGLPTELGFGMGGPPASPAGAGNELDELGLGGPPNAASPKGDGNEMDELGLGGPPSAASPKGDGNEMDELGLAGPQTAEKILKSKAAKSNINIKAPIKNLGNEASELGGLLGNGTAGNDTAGNATDLVCNGTQCNDTLGNDATGKSEVNETSNGNGTNDGNETSDQGNDTSKVVEEAPIAEPTDGCPPELGPDCGTAPKKLKVKKAPKPKAPVKKVWWNGPNGVKKLPKNFVPSPLCDPTDITSFANLNCYEKIYHPGFPSTPPDPTGPTGGAMGDS
jgi:hypothetical protein